MSENQPDRSGEQAGYTQGDGADFTINCTFDVNNNVQKKFFIV